MKRGIVSLKPLYELIRSTEQPQTLLRLNGKVAPGKAYTRVCDELTSQIADAQGFYLWGCYDQKGLWKNIYLGKAGLGKTANLRSRVREELKDERCFAWRPLLPKEAILAAGKELHRKMWLSYESHWNRALLKEGATFIAWVSAPNVPGHDVLRIEADLIESLNPTANIKRPAPPRDLQQDTRDIFALLRRSIHEGRTRKFYMTLFRAGVPLPQREGFTSGLK